jgi:hypothetical protein
MQVRFAGALALLLAAAGAEAQQQLPPNTDFTPAPSLSKPHRPFADRDKLVAAFDKCGQDAHAVTMPLLQGEAVKNCARLVQNFIMDNQRIQWTGTVAKVAPLTPRGAAIEIQIAPNMFLGALEESGQVFPMGVTDDPSPLYTKLRDFSGGETVKFTATLWQIFYPSYGFPDVAYIGATVNDIEVLEPAK